MEMIELLNSINLGFLLYKNDLLLVYIPYKFIWSGLKKTLANAFPVRTFEIKEAELLSAGWRVPLKCFLGRKSQIYFTDFIRGK